jgi:uncharacterized protein DUF6011
MATYRKGWNGNVNWQSRTAQQQIDDSHEHSAMFTNAGDAMTFIQAGNATVTLRSKETEKRYTYRIRESDDGKLFFVSVMWGSDNESDFAYIGIIRNGEFQHTAKSKIEKDDIRWRAFSWAYNILSQNRIPASLEVWHEGRCGCCGRKLTVPESIERGIGPECAKKVPDTNAQKELPVNHLVGG